MEITTQRVSNGRDIDLDSEVLSDSREDHAQREAFIHGGSV